MKGSWLANPPRIVPRWARRWLALLGACCVLLACALPTLAAQAVVVQRERELDAARRRRPGFVSRNTWILEAITEKLQREVLGRAP